MGERAVPASEVRDKFADYLEGVEKGGRVIVTTHGKERAYLISVRELRALEETVGVLENSDLMKSIRRGLDDVKAGRVQNANDAFAELDAEFLEKE